MLSRVPNYYPDISRRLSQVMDEIGVNEKTVNVRRHTGLLCENMETLENKLVHDDWSTRYRFGSQTEGTTTLGLNPDTDMLSCLNKVNVIQDWSDWKRGKINLIMIDDDRTPQGYCRLQCLRSDIPVAREDLPDQHFEYDDRGRVIMMNTFTHGYQQEEGHIRHGPAGCYKHINLDIVHAYPCKTWPRVADTWIDRYCAKQPRKIHLVRKSVQSGCFLVPTGHCLSPNERLEWRISTSVAERYIMFNMNITQIRCYVLLKMMIKTFIEPDFPETISSYHCKTVLMYLVENSQYEYWQEDKLMTCVIVCWKMLQTFIITNSCPHYFIPGNNLMAGRLGIQTRHLLVVALEHIICTFGHAVLEISIDSVGELLREKCSYLPTRCNYRMSVQTHYLIYKALFLNVMLETLKLISDMRLTGDINTGNVIREHKSFILDALAAYRRGGRIEREAVVMFMPLLCTRTGCLLASQCITQGQNICNEALEFFSLGIDSDVASGRLKLASALYCAGDLERTVAVLCDVEDCYNNSVRPVCCCQSTDLYKSLPRLPLDILHIENLNSLRAYFAFGVSFTRGEIHCVPLALQYEMFRCTDEEIASRNKFADY